MPCRSHHLAGCDGKDWLLLHIVNKMSLNRNIYKVSYRQQPGAGSPVWEGENRLISISERLTRLEPLWGTWYIQDFIGEGSFGKVYKLRREDDFNKLRREDDFNNIEYQAALKWIPLPQRVGEIDSLRAEGMSEEDVRSYYEDLALTLRSEIRFMNALSGNTNIVNYSDHLIRERPGEIGWDILIRMELLTPLDKIIQEQPFSERDVAMLGLHMCQALALCAQHQVLHRDIKPENIFMSADGNYKLGDFGVSRTMESTAENMSRKGTPMYMSPEVYFKKPTDFRADLYSLGLVLYRLLNGNRMPFLPTSGTPTTNERENAISRRLRGDALPPPISGSRELKNIVLKACAFKPEHRFASAEKMRQELGKLIRRGQLSEEELFPQNRGERDPRPSSDRTPVDPDLPAPPDPPAPSKSPVPSGPHVSGDNSASRTTALVYSLPPEAGQDEPSGEPSKAPHDSRGKKTKVRKAGAEWKTGKVRRTILFYVLLYALLCVLLISAGVIYYAQNSPSTPASGVVGLWTLGDANGKMRTEIALREDKSARFAFYNLVSGEFVEDAVYNGTYTLNQGTLDLALYLEDGTPAGNFQGVFDGRNDVIDLSMSGQGSVRFVRGAH